MEYERIHKVQTGLLSPSKLRMKLIGPHHQKRKDASNSNSSRTSPSKLEDSEFVKNSLLDVQNGVEEEGPDCSRTMQQRECTPRENADSISSKVLQSLRGDNANASTLHQPARALDDENLDYDSTSSFEFHKERSHPQHVARSFSRPMSSKWNDAEKWIMNRQNFLPASSKKMHFPYQTNRSSAINTGRVVPEAANHEHKPSVKRVDFCLQGPHPGSEKLDFVSNGLHPMPVRGDGENALIDLCPESKDLMEVDNTLSSSTKDLTENTSGIPSIRSVCMRDMGTEMTPIPSQEPSRTATPVNATTPRRSPASSIPSTPRRDEPAPTPIELYINNATQSASENGKRDMSDQEIKLKARREIVALGVQLGKMNIAAWASKDEKDRASAFENGDPDECKQIEFAKRAAAWEEAEKAKHVARFKREEIKIQAWESEQKAKLEAEMRRTEAQVEQLRAQAQAKMVKKLAMASQKSDEKRVAAEARKNRHAQKVAAKAEYIRQSGRLPSSSFICCGWS